MAATAAPIHAHPPAILILGTADPLTILADNREIATARHQDGQGWFLRPTYPRSRHDHILRLPGRMLWRLFQRDDLEEALPGLIARGEILLAPPERVPQRRGKPHLIPKDIMRSALAAVVPLAEARAAAMTVPGLHCAFARRAAAAAAFARAVAEQQSPADVEAARRAYRAAETGCAGRATEGCGAGCQFCPSRG